MVDHANAMPSMAGETAVTPSPTGTETTLEFYGGVELIGGSKIMIATSQARVLLDMGLDIPVGNDLFRPPVVARSGFELADLLNTGRAPDLPGIYHPEQLPVRGPRAVEVAGLAESDPRPTAVFVSHAHIDHDGMLGFVRPDVPCYAHPQTVDIHAALQQTGMAPAGHPVRLLPCTDSQPVQVGDLAVEAIPVDHDVPGACGFLIHTPHGRVAYTGDINLHRNDGRKSRDFARRVQGADVLITETTMLSFDPLPSEAVGEVQVSDHVSQLLTDHPAALQLISLYPRDLDRAARMITVAERADRQLVWPGEQAAFLSLMGVSNVVTWAPDRPQRSAHCEAVRAAEAAGRSIETVSLNAVAQAPGQYVVQLDHHDLPALLDLPLNDDTCWIHSQGEPLGPFVPEWEVFVEWLDHAGVTLVEASSSGHAGPSALVDLVRQIDAQTIYPIHGFRPEALVEALAESGEQVVVPRLGESYPVGVR